MPRAAQSSDDVSSLKPAVFYILLALAAGDSYGYAVMQTVREVSAGRVPCAPAPSTDTWPGSSIRGLVGESSPRRPATIAGAALLSTHRLGQRALDEDGAAHLTGGRIDQDPPARAKEARVMRLLTAYSCMAYPREIRERLARGCVYAFEAGLRGAAARGLARISRSGRSRWSKPRATAWPNVSSDGQPLMDERIEACRRC